MPSEYRRPRWRSWQRWVQLRGDGHNQIVPAGSAGGTGPGGSTGAGGAKGQ
jgi:hypothetical protein